MTSSLKPPIKNAYIRRLHPDFKFECIMNSLSFFPQHTGMFDWWMFGGGVGANFSETAKYMLSKKMRIYLASVSNFHNF